MPSIRYSFIIPVKAINDYIREAVPKILAIARDDFEILIYPDEINTETWPKTRQIGTGRVGPAEKRTRALTEAQGDIFVFIDDDAYPRIDFLEQLHKDFMDTAVAAVGGPGITPPDDGFWQRVSGAVFLSQLSGGNPERYVPIGQKRFIDDWPSVNLSIRKEVFVAIGGFDCAYWPGEDTKLCFEITQKLQGKILYDPELVVYHHRREGLRRHLRQVGRYGIHRGFFVKKFPQTSRRVKYFVPSIWLLFVVVGAILAAVFPLFQPWYHLGWGIYALAMAKAVFDVRRYEKDWRILPHVVYYILFTHVSYGVRFLQGLLFTKELKSKLRT